ncbi:MAG: outer membrane beta-barrel protein [Gemmatimonadales bacterium]
MRHLTRAIGVLLGVAASGGTGFVIPASAQGSVSLTPFAGIYVPTRNSFSVVGTDIKRRNSFIGGARLTFWGKSPVGLELSAGLSPARTTFAGATVNGDRDTNVFLGALKLMVGLSPATSSVGIHLGVGPAIIRRGKDVLQQERSVTDLGGAVGLGIRVPLAPHVGLRFDAEDYLYGGDFDGSKKFQNDLALTVGLSLSF